MILDETFEFCDATDVSAAAGTAVGGDVVDLGANVKNIGRGEQMFVVIQVTTAFTSGGSATVNFQLDSDSTSDLATSPTTHYQTGAVAIADLVAGKKYIFALPQGVDYERYLGINVTTAVATTTAGAINAFLTKDVDNWHAYADAQN